MTQHYLEWVDQSEVIKGDVVVVVLDVGERLLVVFHQRVDLSVLPLLDLVDFGFPSKLEVVAEDAHLLLVFRFDFCHVVRVMETSKERKIWKKTQEMEELAYVCFTSSKNYLIATNAISRFLRKRAWIIHDCVVIAPWAKIV